MIVIGRDLHVSALSALLQVSVLTASCSLLMELNSVRGWSAAGDSSPQCKGLPLLRFRNLQSDHLALGIPLEHSRLRVLRWLLI